MQPYILPPPSRVAVEMFERFDLLCAHATWTAPEIVLGLALGLHPERTVAIVSRPRRAGGAGAAPGARLAGHPVFAIAPLLVLWLGYGMVSKVAWRRW